MAKHSSGTYAPSSERKGKGYASGSKEMGGMNPGKVGTKKLAAKRYFEGGANSYSPKGMSNAKNQERDD